MSASEIRKYMELIEGTYAPLDLDRVSNTENSPGEYNVGRKVYVPHPDWGYGNAHSYRREAPLVLGKIIGYHRDRIGGPLEGLDYRVQFDTPVDMGPREDVWLPTENKYGDAPGYKNPSSWYKFTELKFVD